MQKQRELARDNALTAFNQLTKAMQAQHGDEQGLVGAYNWLEQAAKRRLKTTINKKLKNPNIDIAGQVMEECLAHLNALTGKGFAGCPKYKELIRTILATGQTAEHIKLVHEYKFETWGSWDAAINLKPSTLWGKKFAQYLDEAEAAQKQTANRGKIDDDYYK